MVPAWPDEPKVLSLGAYGPEMDFFTIKGAVETVLEGLRISDVRFTAERENPSYHPGRCAKVYAGDTLLGVVGQIHPHVAAITAWTVNFTPPSCPSTRCMPAWERGLSISLCPSSPPLPGILAVVCDRTVPVADLEACIRKGAKGLLKEVTLFDIYTGTASPRAKRASPSISPSVLTTAA